MTSVPGVAQRTGATNYYVELFPKTGAKANTRPPVLGLTPVPGDVDIVIASELMEAGRAVQRGLVTPDRTTFIVSTNRVYAMTEKIALADGRVDSARVARRLPHGGQAAHPRRHGATRGSDRQRDHRPCCSARSPAPRRCRCSAWRSRRRSIAAASASRKASRRSAPASPRRPTALPAKAAAPVGRTSPPALAPLMAEAERLSRAGAHVRPRRHRAARRLSGHRLRARLSRPAEADRRGRQAPRQRLGPAARRDRARARARHGLRGHGARRRAEDPAEPLRARARRRCRPPTDRSSRSPSSCIRACRRSPTRCRPGSAAGCSTAAGRAASSSASPKRAGC